MLSALPDVSTTLSAFTMITKSPVSRCGAKIGLCLPRSTRAISVHRRPSTRPSASMTYQSRWISLALGEYVRTKRTFCSGVGPGRTRPQSRVTLRVEGRALPTAGSGETRKERPTNSGGGGQRPRRRRVGVAAPPTAKGREAGRAHRRTLGRGPAGSRRRGRRACGPAPTSTSVPTIARTICWQKAFATISKRSRPSSRSSQSAETTVRTRLRPSTACGRTTRSRARR